MRRAIPILRRGGHSTLIGLDKHGGVARDWGAPPRERGGVSMGAAGVHCNRRAPGPGCTATVGAAGRVHCNLAWQLRAPSQGLAQEAVSSGFQQ